ncbi:efflux RND transporter permease subunit [Caminibacter mediatlanticus]|uniref:Acriflavin resistance protein n=1 Tax=Caminibacter mediatlanticus TB-2 TaxID=391592 RepID=A0AAI9AG59_9BACT|nr:efflux RND transporter permease subunit [Caminibacter mediatlanticus]EDM23023.1 Acriflavin resistance protein [Caminibacter mediatlanticus TB-2]
MERLKRLKELLAAKKREFEEKKFSDCDINELKNLENEIINIEKELEKVEKEILKEEKELKEVEEELKLNIAGKLARIFLKNPLTPVLAIVFLLMGLIAVLFTPREENPQIDVPAANIIVMYPGASSKEVQNIVVDPLSRVLKAMTGVKHVYGMAMNSVGIVTVRFKIGEDKVRSIAKLYDRVMQNFEKMPKGVMPPLFKPIDIDEVPIVTFALSSKKYNDAKLYRIAQRLLSPLAEVKNVSIIGIKGGHKRQFNIIVDPQKLAAYHLSIGQIAMALKGANVDYPLGGMDNKKYSIPVEFDGFIKSVKDVENLVVANYMGRPIYIKDIAKVEDGVDFQNKHKTYFTGGKAFYNDPLLDGKEVNKFPVGEKLNQVTIFIGKKRGSNAVFVAEAVIKKMEELKKSLPKDVKVYITRNDGEKANHAVNELIYHLFISLGIIVILLIIMLGIREALIVSFTVPLILGITLFIGMLAGQTINRITLFALILSLGLLVDSAIIVIENIHRHFEIGDKPREYAAIYATNEIGNPTNIATLAIILAFVPMFFVTGMMGPYMRPIPFNVPVAMIASLLVAYIFTPWAAVKFLPEHKHEKEPFDIRKTKTYKIFYNILNPLLNSTFKRVVFFSVLLIALVGSMALPVFKIVLFKMLPSANKNTFNITIDLPKGSSIEATTEVSNCVANILKKEPEIHDFEQFIGISGVVDFNGLLRGSSMKQGENYGEIRVNLYPKEKGRKESSIDMVSRLRPIIQGKCSIHNANIKLVEDPPGPPVIATLLMQVFGGDEEGRLKLANYIEEIYKKTPKVVDIDIMRDRQIIKYKIIPDKEKAALLGISTDQIAKVLGVGLRGAVISVAHIPSEKEQVGIYVRFDKKDRNSLKALDNIKLMSMTTHRLVPLKEVVKVIPVKFDGMITSKDLREMVMVTGEMDKRGSLYALLDIFSYLKDKGIPGYKIIYDGNPRLNLKAIDLKTGKTYDLIWGGEWELTFDVFRDLGSAFGVAVILIYLLMVAYYKNFRVPRIVLAAVPLTFIGVLPGHAIMNWITLALFNTKTYFTATSMIGFIALAGIVVRNSLLLIDFTNDLIKRGRSINEAVIEAAATRFRPIILTALAIILASFVIVLDPVWQGLAVALIFGVLASTLLSVIVVPILYWRYLISKEKKEKHIKYGLKEV